jgi:hypothetical protein
VFLIWTFHRWADRCSKPTAQTNRLAPRWKRAIPARADSPWQITCNAPRQPRIFVFMGYREKAGVIEVISYNEAAGRFDFQLGE